MRLLSFIIPFLFSSTLQASSYYLEEAERLYNAGTQPTLSEVNGWFAGRMQMQSESNIVGAILITSRNGDGRDMRIFTGMAGPNFSQQYFYSLDQSKVNMIQNLWDRRIETLSEISDSFHALSSVSYFTDEPHEYSVRKSHDGRSFIVLVRDAETGFLRAGGVFDARVHP